jgi:hypothetical protein
LSREKMIGRPSPHANAPPVPAAEYPAGRPERRPANAPAVCDQPVLYDHRQARSGHHVLCSTAAFWSSHTEALRLLNLINTPGAISNR